MVLFFPYKWREVRSDCSSYPCGACWICTNPHGGAMRFHQPIWQENWCWNLSSSSCAVIPAKGKISNVKQGQLSKQDFGLTWSAVHCLLHYWPRSRKGTDLYKHTHAHREKDKSTAERYRFWLHRSYLPDSHGRQRGFDRIFCNVSSKAFWRINLSQNCFKSHCLAAQRNESWPCISRRDCEKAEA